MPKNPYLPWSLTLLAGMILMSLLPQYDVVGKFMAGLGLMGLIYKWSNRKR